MENKQFPSNKKLISIQEEKLICEFDYDSTTGAATCSPKQLLLLEILQQGPGYREPSQDVFVSIKQKAPPIKTLYIAEKKHFHSKKSSDRSGSRLAIGDHSSFNTRFSKYNTNIRNSIAHSTQQQGHYPASDLDAENYSSSSSQIKSTCTSKCSCCHISSNDICENNQRKRAVKKCYESDRPHLTMNISKVDPNTEKVKTSPKKVDIATLVVTNTPSKDVLLTFSGAINKLHRRIDHLERKILRQEMVFRTFDPNIPLSSSDEEVKDNVMRTTSGIGRPGCSYIEQYSHIPETSAFQKYSHQGSTLSPSKATTLDKEHNSEQYGRDFTTYDGITTRGKRQCASVPCKRDDIPKVAAERVHKIRHKLNPVRDYRLMDTVHYLAQGEFAPRDDGIKLTPSREAVLSDIIWEDVCRTHWPNTRLGRRIAHSERYSARGELQRLIDNLLRERVAHVERRKRRHYRIVKLNNRHENCRPVGKTGDIIVASHKNRSDSNRDINDQKATSAVMTDRRRAEQNPRKSHRSHDRLIIPGMPTTARIRSDDCSPGPSYAAYTSSNGVSTNCYHTSTPSNQRKNNASCSTGCKKMQDLTSGSTISAYKGGSRQPRLIVKKDASRRKAVSKDEPDLEHFILLPTLVVRTPSNVKRQKKFNELYHRILNVHINEVQHNPIETALVGQSNSVPNKKDIGFNINITLSDTEESAMEGVKNWNQDSEVIKKNGLYVHYSLPKVLGGVSSQRLRQWAREGARRRLERAVLMGQGGRLLAAADAVPLSRRLQDLIAKCKALHAAVERGSLVELQELLEPDCNRKKYVTCFDEAGVGLLHKAVYYNYLDIAKWLVHNYPHLVHLRDSEGRTALHYTAACRDEATAAALLERAGAERGARDGAGRTLAHYRAARTSLALPDAAAAAAAVMPARPNATGLVIKRHNIRIWCHECDMGRLQRVVWEGHGARLLSEVSSQPVVRKFLEAVPYLMNTIRDTHNAVIQNDLEGLIKLTSDPVPPQALSSRDINNMTVMHKAAGLGHGGILKYIIERYPQGINDVDNDGRTPLHYAATVKDEQHTYNTLVDAGADESVVDNKNRTPGYYINRFQEIDKTMFHTLPDAPRTPSSVYPSSWDWKILSTDFIADLNKKSRKKNLKTSNENISSKKTTTSTISESLENQTTALKGSSTHELISSLPELDDTEKTHIENKNDKNNQESEDNQKQIEHDVNEQEEKNELVGENIETANNIIEENTDANDIIEDNEEKDNLNDTTQAPEDKKDPEIGHDETEENTENPEENEEGAGSIDKVENKPDIGDDYNKDEIDKPETSQEQYEMELVDGVTENYNDTVLSETLPVNGENKNDSETDEKENSEKEEEEKSETLERNTPENNLDNNSDRVNVKEGLKEEDGEKQTKPTDDEGNYTSDHNEDDDDVQVQGDCHSENSDDHNTDNLAIDENSISARGNPNPGRNTHENLIEGIISGEAEQDSQDASMTHRGERVGRDILIVDNEIDPEVTELINTTNMEMLATLVLNGEGSRLIGRHSENAELQAFLDNVPTYMQKIHKVHLAAKEGNIRDLQAALDRRKFAIARDPVSPNGATPLHVATVFGKTNIIKYLGGRFPETLSAVDFEGRTALHYGAVLPDNGHYYNLLQQLGANSKDLDDNGHSAEDYYKDPTLLSFNQLLMDFGISEEEAKNMLSDKGLNNAANGHMDIPVFHTEEGRYLAKSLGDPLIKGLTEVANVKPKDPIAFLASFLQNFPDQEKPRLGTQESNTLITEEEPEVENEHLPTNKNSLQAEVPIRSAARTATRPHRPIDVIAVDPQLEASPDGPEAAFSSENRDEHGQSMLHFAAARAHTNNALFQLLQESDVSLGYRDELYRTARDVSIQANVPDNTVEIDKWVLHLAARGKTDKIMELLMQGYDHILDVVDEDGVPITEVVSQRGDSEMSNLLASIPAFEESRESLHGAIRRGDLDAVKEMLAAEGGRTLACGQNSYGRTSLHVAVLIEHEDIVAYLAETYPELLRIGDNLERSPLHYAMGVDKIESLSRILIRAGAKRVLKDLKGRQPTYYFMNKSDILRLQEEESVN